MIDAYEAGIRAVRLWSLWKRVYGRHAQYALPYAAEWVADKNGLDRATVRKAAREVCGDPVLRAQAARSA